MPVVRIVDLLAIELSQQNERKGAVYVRRSIPEDVADPDDQPVRMQPGRVVQAGEREKLNFDFGKGRSGPEFAMGVYENRL
jgi:hypothetical protein